MSLKSISKKLLSQYGYTLQKLPHYGDAYGDQVRLLKQLQVKTVFDVGAHTGQTSSKYRQLFSDAIIYAFEPFDESFREFKKVHSNDQLIKAIKLGVLNRWGKETFYANRFSQTNSMLTPSAKIYNYYDAKLLDNLRKTEIDVVTIDKFTADNSIEEIDILKLDIQGTELLALKGAAENLRRKAISLIYAEVEFVYVYHNQALFYELCDFLASMDYKLYNLYNLHNGLNGQLVAGDAIFVRPDLIDAIK